MHAHGEAQWTGQDYRGVGVVDGALGDVPVTAGIGCPAGRAPGAGVFAGGSVVVSELGFVVGAA